MSLNTVHFKRQSTFLVFLRTQVNDIYINVMYGSIKIEKRNQQKEAIRTEVSRVS